jgi:homogentisate 1,2-dioxygenase
MELRYIPSMEKKYLRGFRNHFQSEAIAGAIPPLQNSPQRHSLGLYAEQISGSAFTAPRSENFKTWVYRIRPSVQHGRFEKAPQVASLWQSHFLSEDLDPNPLRWDTAAKLNFTGDFLDGVRTAAGVGSPADQKGASIGWYGMSKPMENSAFYSADGELVLIPQSGTIEVRTEMGILGVEPGEIVCIPRGIRAQVNPAPGKAFGYYCENFGIPFRLPDLGPIGANGLANPRHFEVPQAAFENTDQTYRVVAKIGGKFFTSHMKGSPFDVVGWNGNYAPYKYDLRKYNTINTVSFDHPDPSIFTVLTSPSEIPGCANLDFVIFPPRWMVAEKTFRPPYFHRNVMSEWMGLIFGAYDAKAEGFLPGGASLHNCMTGHGPDNSVYEAAARAELKPEKIDQTLAFMWESRYAWIPTQWAVKTSGLLQKDYQNCWETLKPAPVK